MLPTRTISLTATSAAKAIATDGWDYAAEITARLADEDVTIAPPGAPAANAVAILITGEIGTAANDAGRRFQVARYGAVITLGTARVEVRGKPGVSADLDAARAVARADVIERIVTALTYAY